MCSSDLAGGPRAPAFASGGDVALGAATATAGSVLPKDAQEVLAKNRFKLRGCYSQALHDDPTAHGIVVVTVKVGDGGEVVSAIAKSTSVAIELTGCVVAKLRALKFEEPEKGGTTSFDVPMTFTPRKI